MSEKTSDHFLNGANRRTRLSRNPTLIEQFEAQVTRVLDKSALISGDETLSYSELNIQANRLAHHLIRQGVGPESIVGIALERSPELIVALLGVLKAGAVYMPLDPEYPDGRLVHLLQDAIPHMVITSEIFQERFGRISTLLVCIDCAEVKTNLVRSPSHNPENGDRIAPLQDLHPAYVIFTSGSTGQPKGVVVEHAALSTFIESIAEHVILAPDDRHLSVTTVSFDISILEVLMPLIKGATVVLATKSNLDDPVQFASLIRNCNANSIQATPSHWRIWFNYNLDCLKNVRVQCGGEPLPVDLARQLYQASNQVCNLYGPSEATIWATAYLLSTSPENLESVPIGKPLVNYQVYVLDANLEPVPIGVEGEMYIAGAGLARGYLNRPDLTAERFVADPYGEPGTRMYRTGDLARWRGDGVLEFLGRVDEQVKIRGFRIEPGEVEAVLMSEAGIAHAAVVAREDGPGGKYLSAYVVLKQGFSLNAEQLRQSLGQRLPSYMVPAAFVELSTLPLTPNGKLNRKALPAPQWQRENEYQAPRTNEERILCNLFAEVLKLPRVGLDDHFFYLGGHSLLATRLVSRIRNSLGIEMSLRSLFETPTVRELSIRLPPLQTTHLPLTPMLRPERLPLSHSQQQLWFLYRLEGPSPTYNIPIVIRLEGALNQSALETALEDLVGRHEVLRTIFPEEEQACQRILSREQARPRLVVEMVSEAELENSIQQAAASAIDLCCEPPLRAFLYQQEEHNHVLLLVIHHIACDGGSVEPLMRDLSTAYAARCHGIVPKFIDLSIQYADYTLWQQELLGSSRDPQSRLSRELDHWCRVLAGAPEELNLPYDHPRPARPSYCGRTVGFLLDSDLHQRLQELAQATDATLFMLLQAGVAVLLGKLGAGEDIPIGSPIAGRQDEALEGLVGFFMNTLVLRADLSGNPSFRKLLDRVRAFDLAAYEYQELPFKFVVEALKPTRQLARNPLFQVMVVLQNRTDTELILPGLKVEVEELNNEGAKFDLTFSFQERIGSGRRLEGIEGTLEYSLDLFEPATGENIAARLIRVLEVVVEHPDEPLHLLSLLNLNERYSVLDEPNSTRHLVDEASVSELFEAQVERLPEADALVFGEKRLSYRELNQRANRLGHYLISRGVGAESIIGIALERSPELIVAMLGVLKAGAAYLPLDPEYAEARLAYMIKDARPTLVLSTTSLSKRLPQQVAEVVLLDSSALKKVLDEARDHNPVNTERTVPHQPQHPAYVIYTSGTTGNPKGVVVTHVGIPSLASAQIERLSLSDRSRVLLFASFSFDASFAEIVTAFAAGATLVIVSKDQRAGSALRDVLVAERVTHVTLPPAVLRDLKWDEDLQLEGLIVAGEAWSTDQVSSWFGDRSTRIFNAYGPTETTVCATMSAAVSHGKASLIGMPIWNTRVYVLDANLEPVPIGVEGEMYIAGAGLARGYLNRPALTAERFVADPYGEPGTRMYRTGDLARWRGDGVLEFLGRVDEQVKIRGFRIEPGEVEAVLMSEAGIAHAAVVAREDGPGGKYLSAYVVLKQGFSLNAEQLRQSLGQRLPSYMVPAAFVELSTLPLTPNGKLNRKALPAPQWQRENEYQAPRTNEERILCDLFAEVLKLPQVGVTDNFFSIGGDSILSILLVSRVRQAGLELNPRDIFEHPSVAALVTAKPWERSLLPCWDESAGVGEVIATPIMRHLLEQVGPFKRFHQSMLLQSPVNLTVVELCEALQRLLDYHDALRLRVQRAEDGRYTLLIAPRGSVLARDCMTHVDVSGLDGSARRVLIEAEIESAQSRLDPEKNVMFQTIWFSDAGAGRLYLAIHHLAVDGVSWRILVSDLVQAIGGQEITFSSRGTPFRVWAQHLAQKVLTPEIQAELKMWEKCLNEGVPLINNAVLNPAKDTVDTMKHLRMEFPQALTRSLLTNVPAAYHAQVNDVLLTALVVAVIIWRQKREGEVSNSLLIDLEGHGREPLDGWIDLSRTVGWFTSLYPVNLDIGDIEAEQALLTGAALGGALKRIKEQLRAIPRRGIGYGMLRQLDPDSRLHLAARRSPQLCFNYLGRFDAGKEGEAWSAAPEQTCLGGGADAKMPLFHLLEINAMTVDDVEGSCLRVEWSWAERHLGEAEVRSVAELWQRALEALVEHVEQPSAGGHTPSDFPLTELTQGQVEWLEEAYPGLENILPLSPLQEGLLFHALYDASAADVYTVQLKIEFEGPLDAGRLRKATEALLTRYPNLGVAIAHQKLDRPVQIICSRSEIPWREEDLSALSVEKKQLHQEELLTQEREERFDFSTGPLLRCALLRLERERYLFVFTNHHLLMDGWSLSVVVSELMTFYQSGGTSLTLQPVRPYSEYLSWLTTQDNSRALNIWQEYIAGIEGATQLAHSKWLGKRSSASVRWQLDLPPDLTATMQELAKKCNVTLNTVIQGVWALLLQSLTGRDDVVFGITVSGRPAELDGVERMVGLFINTLPLRVRLKPDDTLLTLLVGIQESQTRMLSHQHLGLADILRTAGGGELFDTLLVFENYPMDRALLSEEELGLRVKGIEGIDSSHYSVSVIAQPGLRLKLRIDFDLARLSEGTPALVTEKLVALIEAATNYPKAPLHRLGIQALTEKLQLTETHVQSHSVPKSAIPELFEIQADRLPNAIALLLGDKSLSYGELNRQANYFAHRLIQMGVKPDTLVGICLDRSFEMVVALLGILKAGGAYMPIDANLPRLRLSKLVVDVGLRYLVTRKSDLILFEDLVEHIVVVDTATQYLDHKHQENPVIKHVPDQLAYVMFTSGSTGEAKGVLITHRGVVRLVHEATYVQLDQSCRLLQLAPLSFDASTFEIWGALLNGSSLVIMPPGHTSAEEISCVVTQYHVDTLWLTSGLFDLMVAHKLEALSVVRQLVAGGDVLSVEHVQQVLNAHSACRMLNGYGPTENTTFTCCYTVPPDANLTMGVPIGFPIHHTTCYVLDSWLNVVPIGVEGEMYIAGAGLARGYLNRPALTAERFVADPYGELGTRMYRTGDLARWRGDGVLEFLGRVDEQVKIRGFRIEPGEVEAVLMSEAGIVHAAVVAREDGPGGKYLSAYVVLKQGFSLNAEQLRQSLGQRLPSYMVPAAFVELSTLPLTPNGKLNRKALPAPQWQRENEYQAPRTNEERILCDLFAEVLKLPQVGVTDNFFSIGGDSILSILLVSRVRQAGLELNPRDIFEHPSVAALVTAKPWERSLLPCWDESAGVGEVIATPIMRHLLEQVGPFKRFHQSMLLQSPVNLTVVELCEALQRLLDYHDALRLRVQRAEDGRYTLLIAPRGSVLARDCMTHVDVSGLNGSARRVLIEAEIESAQSRLDPEKNVMFQTIWFSDAGAGRLYLAIHHLAVDGVSWRILVSDLVQAIGGQEITSSSRGTPFRVWAQHLTQKVLTPEIQAELKMWEKCLNEGVPLINNAVLNPAKDTVDTMKHLRMEFPQALTRSLLTNVPAAYHAQVNDVLLTALVVAVIIWRQKREGEVSNSLLIDLEGHGREPLDGWIDLSRTVGWFTSLYPVNLDIGDIEAEQALLTGAALGGALKRIKEQLRAIPRRGIGYGMLRQLDPDSRLHLAARRSPQLCFNYLGRFDAGKEGEAWSAAPEQTCLGGGADAKMPLFHLLEINAMTVDDVEGSCLRVEWSWAERHLGEAEVRSVAELWQRALEALVEHVEQPSAGGHTPSDFPLTELTQGQVEWLEEAYPGLENILPLSPLQEGLLFHALYDASAADVYTVQLKIEFEGPLDAGRLRKATEALLTRYPNLGVAIAHQKLDRPVQIICSRSEIPWREEDLSALSVEKKQLHQEELLTQEREERFDFSTGPLLRCALLRLERERYLFVFTNHHLLMDGWSLPVFIGELLTCYHQGGSAIPRVPPYAEYLSWLDRQNQDGALEQWGQYLAGLDGPTRLTPPDQTASGISGFYDIEVSLVQTACIQGLARTHGLTLNTLVEGLWAIMLQQITGRDDIVFGITVSGRPAELNGVERMVGLFINTLPLRVRLKPEDTLLTLLAGIQESQARMLSHQHVGLADILQTAGGGELFDTLLVFENYPLDRASLSEKVSGLSVSDIEVLDATHFPLSLMAVPGERMLLRLSYDGERISSTTVENLAARLRQLLEKAVQYPDSQLYQINPLSREERHTVLELFNATRLPIGSASLIDQIEAQVACFADNPAIIFGEETLSYGELNLQANRLAHYLIRRGVGPESIIGIMLERSPDLIVAMLGVLKAGAAYLPLDPEYPKGRLAGMIEDAKPTVIITSSDLQYHLPQSIVELIVLDGSDTQADLARTTARNPVDADRTFPLLPLHPAYVIYTSGSTGKPKGVVIEHCALVNKISTLSTYLRVTQITQYCTLSSIGFDPLTEQIFCPLCSGATAVVVPDDIKRDRSRLTTYLKEHAVSIVNITPLHAADLLHNDGVKLQCEVLLVGGDTFPYQLASSLKEANFANRVFNIYGPTETCIDACCHDIDSTSSLESVPIGKPLVNYQVYVLDANLEPVPIGVEGEMYIAGAGLARGYLNRPALTAERFVADPYGEPGTRMYRTGDLARWRGDGVLEFLGRVDEQVKIRGFRIEPGEVEAVLMSEAGIAHAAVVAREDGPGGKYLSAYVVLKQGFSLNAEQLRQSLGQRLPSYMVPAAFVELSTLPLTPNGKLNRKALPAPQWQRENEYQAPRTNEERILCNLFAEVLKLPRVGLDDHFFYLGGHSLLATRLVSRIRNSLGIEMSLRSLFETPTVRELSIRLPPLQTTHLPLTPMLRPERLPLSHSQQQLWFLYRLEGPSPTYNIPIVIRLEGALNQSALETALEDLVGRHEVLRTIFPEEEQACQRILSREQARPRLVVEMVSEAELENSIQQAAASAIDLCCEPPLRAFLYQQEEHNHVLLLVIHHIACDGGSVEPLMRDLSTAYAARCHGIVPKFIDLSIQYADYTLWQQELLGSSRDPQSRLSRELDHWCRVLAGAPEELNLPYDHPRPARPSYCGRTVGFLLDSDLHQRLQELAQATDATLFMLLQAGVAVLLGKLGAGEDIPIGSPIAGRQDEALEGLVGFFMNTLVLRADLSGNPSFRKLLDRVRAFDLAAYEYQELPFKFVVEALKPTRQLARNPLFQVMVVLQNRTDTELILPGLKVEVEELNNEGAKFDLTFSFQERIGSGRRLEGIEGTLEYSLDLFEPATGENIAARLIRVLEVVVEHPDEPLHLLSLLNLNERYSVLDEPNSTRHLVDEASVSELFEAQVERLPEADALVFGEKRLSYRELNQRANRLGHYLISRGVGAESIIGIALERSPELIVAMLGVLKAGAAYLPLDPEYAEARLAYMIKDARPTLVLSTTSLSKRLPQQVAEVVLLDSSALKKVLDEARDHNPVNTERTVPHQPQHPAYVIYTSGTTGNPKGVVVTHVGIPSLASAQIERLSLSDRSRVLLFASFSFDASFAEIVTAFAAGATLVIVSKDQRAGSALRDVLVAERVTHVTLPPAVLRDLKWDEDLQLEGLIVAGEAWSTDQVSSWFGDRSTRIFNAYGPTETTVCATMSAAVSHGKASLIGMPIWNTRVYVLDANLEPVPIGVEGEMYIAGAGLARGYLNRPALTAERFVADPYGEPGTRMYRTGDLARWRGDGVLEFLGRVDEQVKIRGFRIEPGEVEAVLMSEAGIAHAAVVAREDGPSGKYLSAYVVLKQGFSLNAEQLRQSLGQRLPSYMVPAAFVELSTLPLTPNGKLNRKALPAPQWQRENEYQAPRTNEERILCDLFAEVLKLPRVGLDDHFFYLGGHSLLATRLVSRIRNSLGIEMSLRSLFETPTVRELAFQLKADTIKSVVSPILPLNPHGSLPPFICFPPASGLSWSYAGLIGTITPNRPLYGLQSSFIADGRSLPGSLEDVIEECTTAVRAIQPGGPYYLMGWSFGGNVAHAVSCRLQKAGEQVRLLALMDSFQVYDKADAILPDEEEVCIALADMINLDSSHRKGNVPDMSEILEEARCRGHALGELTADEARRLFPLIRHNASLLRNFPPETFHGDMLLFIASRNRTEILTVEQWAPYCSGHISVYEIACTHGQITEPSNLAEIGQILEEYVQGC